METRPSERQTMNASTRDQRGTVLVTALILLMLVTLAGIIAVSGSMVDTQIAGNARRATMAWQGAEAGVNLAIPIIEDTLLNSTLTPAGPFPVGPITALDTANLENEILGDTTGPADTVTASPDLTMASLGGVAVTADIDRLYTNVIAGGAAQFAMGYEGVGAGVSGGGGGVIYRIQAQGVR